MKIYIDSACDIYYSSFYISGLKQCFGSENISFRNKPFTNLKFNNHFFAFVINEAAFQSRIIIDYADSSSIDKIALEWCDIYCKINIDESINYCTSKLVSIGPGFGINIYSQAKTVFVALQNFLKSGKRVDNSRRFFSNYKAQLKRAKIDDYYPSSEQTDYIYFVGSLWKKEINTNAYRATFIKACLSKKIKFEGGFAPRTKNDLPGYEAITMKARDTMESYITKTKRSIAAFNTPGVMGCHGWKLAEFLCFGKAIISTELSRKLPSKLIDQKHILLTDGSQKDMEEKLALIINDITLRDTLKTNARTYFESELSPVKVIEKIKELHSKLYKG